MGQFEELREIIKQEQEKIRNIHENLKDLPLIDLRKKVQDSIDYGKQIESKLDQMPDISSEDSQYTPVSYAQLMTQYNVLMYQYGVLSYYVMQLEKTLMKNPSEKQNKIE